MTVEVLVAAMNQNDDSLIDKMNIQTDAIVGNQCNRNEVSIFKHGDNIIRYYSFDERGVGLNRNNALIRAKGDICLFADDDMRYVDGYENIVTKAFEEIPSADVIVFNLIEKKQERYVIEKIHRVHWYNFLRYGAARVAVKLDSVKSNNIYFNQCFGGGTEHAHGEDNIFLADCLKKGLKVYAIPYTIAQLINDRESTWNNGYDEKYLIDQGKLYRTISRRLWKLLCLQDAIRKQSCYNKPWVKVYKIMVKNVNG